MANILRLAAGVFGFVLALAFARGAQASDHLDSPTTVANPQADIADVYAWTSSHGPQLNLVMTVQGRTFSDRARYTLHVDIAARRRRLGREGRAR